MRRSQVKCTAYSQHDNENNHLIVLLNLLEIAYKHVCSMLASECLIENIQHALDPLVQCIVREDVATLSVFYRIKVSRFDLLPSVFNSSGES